jgi:hypothetical protein
VTWAAGRDFGVEFIDMSPQEKERLQKLVADLRQGNTRIH